MRKVEEIAEQIQSLSGDWLVGQDWKTWDAQIEADATSGKLDKLISEAKAEYEAGRASK